MFSSSSFNIWFLCAQILLYVFRICPIFKNTFWVNSPFWLLLIGVLYIYKYYPQCLFNPGLFFIHWQMSLNDNASNQHMPNNLLIGQSTASPLCKVVNTIVSALHDTECDGSSTYCQCTLSLQWTQKQSILD